MDYFHIKKILLAEYVANGGKHTEDFLRGMNYLEDYMESGREEHGLNEEVSDVLFLKEVINRLQITNQELKEAVNKKNKIIKNYHSMSKEERRAWKGNNEIKKIEQMYSRMLLELEEKYRKKSFRHRPEKIASYPRNDNH